MPAAPGVLPPLKHGFDVSPPENFLTVRPWFWPVVVDYFLAEKCHPRSVPVNFSKPLFYTYTASQKTLFHLRSCMTSSFAPDYDFGNTSADEFSREPNFAWVKNHIRQTLMTTLPGVLFTKSITAINRFEQFFLNL